MFKSDGTKTRISKGDVLEYRNSKLRVIRPHRNGSCEYLEWNNEEYGATLELWCECTLRGGESIRVLACIIADAVGLNITDHPSSGGLTVAFEFI